MHAEKAASAGALSPRAAAHAALWRQVLDRIHQEHPNWTNARAASKDSWITLPYGASFAWYALFCSGTRPRVELYFGSSDAVANEQEFEAFEQHRQLLEELYGGPLDFQLLPGRKACRIAAHAAEPFDVLELDRHPALAE